LLEIKDTFPSLEYVILIQKNTANEISGTEFLKKYEGKFPIKWNVFTSAEVEKAGKEHALKSFMIWKDNDLMTLTYTSGSTGAPKVTFYWFVLMIVLF
jgi:long-subunit acyl-CoA synthetase (AMP-forming)